MSEPPADNRRPFGSLRAYLELVRLPNIFTAMADVAMGFLLVRPLSDRWDGCILALLLVASSMLYAAGMVLNDLFDFEIDTQQRPARPLPSGRISRTAARWFGGELLLLGAAAAWAGACVSGDLRPGIVAGLLIGCIVLYDGWLKRTPLGPPAMGGCRMLNVLLGMSVAAGPWTEAHWLVAGGIGTYIVGVTWFARREAQTSRRVQLAMATGVMMLGIGLLAWFPGRIGGVAPALLSRWHLLMSVLGVLIGWRCARAVLEPIPPRVQMAVKQCILSLVILDAAVCYVARGMFPAVMILLLLVPAVVVGRWIPST